MTRFERELNGLCGEFWKKDAEQRIAKAEREIESGEMLIDENGIARWDCNGRCIPDDYAEYVEHTKYARIFSRENTAADRDIEVERSAREYRAWRANNGYSEEELFEMRAAFGAGTSIVDVLTGKTIVL